MSATTTRRAMLGAGAALVACGTATAAKGICSIDTLSNPDAALIDLCDEWLRLEKEASDQIVLESRAWVAAGRPKDEDDSSISDAMLHQQSAVMQRLAKTKAFTADGLRAKAKVLVAWASPDPEGDDGLASSLARDLLAEG